MRTLNHVFAAVASQPLEIPANVVYITGTVIMLVLAVFAIVKYLRKR